MMIGGSADEKPLRSLDVYGTLEAVALPRNSASRGGAQAGSLLRSDRGGGERFP